MVLAAGLGTRMRPLTLTTPKPLLKVAGRTMLDHALDHMERAGVELAVVNAHYLADQIVTHVTERQELLRCGPPITLSVESDALETGGGILNALHHLGEEEPFHAANADIVWRDGPDRPALIRLADTWDGETMDLLLLLVRREEAIGYDGPGDFSMDSDGRLIRRGEAASAPFVFAGVQMIHPRAFSDEEVTAPPRAFSMNRIFDRALAAGRLFGLVHDGAWYHVGTPDMLDTADRLIRESE